MTDYYGNYDGGFSTTTTTSQPVSGRTHTAVRSSLTPVTIKQIMDAKQPVPDGEFVVHNVELNMVGFIGVIRKINVFESAISFIIEDGTGSIEVRKWINHDSTSKEVEEEMYTGWVNSYVYVGGALKEFGGKTSIQYPSLYQIKDSNQVIYHYLSAVANHLKRQGVPMPSDKKEQSLFLSENTGGGSSMIDQVFKILQENSPAMTEGVPITYIGQRLNISPEEANKYCQELMEQGRVFNGYEDSGYLCL